MYLCMYVCILVLHCVSGLKAPLLSLNTANHKEYLQVPIRVVRCYRLEGSEAMFSTS